MPWQSKALSDVCVLVTDGSHFSPPSGTEGYPYITVRDIRGDEIDFSQCARIDEKSFLELSRNGCAPQTGDVLFSKDGTVGKVALVDTAEDFVVLSSLAILRPNRSIIDPAYLAYAMRSPDFIARAVGEKTGVAIRRIILKNLKRIPIGFPEIGEQKRIVAILDEAFEGIAKATANAEKSLKCSTELTRSIVDAKLRHVVDNYPTVQLDTLRQQQRVITYGVIKLGDHIDDGVPCLRTSNVRWLDMELGGMKRIRPELCQEYRRTILEGSEVLVNVRGTLGGVAVAGPEMQGWNISREVAMVPTDVRRADPAYLAYWIARTESQNWLTGVLTGATYTGINIEDLRTLPVSLPRLEDQRTIASEIDRALDIARSLKQNCGRKLRELTSLKEALLHRAFSGQLTSADNIAA